MDVGKALEGIWLVVACGGICFFLAVFIGSVCRRQEDQMDLEEVAVLSEIERKKKEAA